MAEAPKPFEVHPSGAYVHGSRADLRKGDLLRPGFGSNFERQEAAASASRGSTVSTRTMWSRNSAM